MRERILDKDDRSTYGTTTAKPAAKGGVEVGGGEKAAAKDQAEKNKHDDEPDSKSNSQHENRPEGPHADPKNTNYEATPGAGTLPDARDQDATGG